MPQRSNLAAIILVVHFHQLCSRWQRNGEQQQELDCLELHSTWPRRRAQECWILRRPSKIVVQRKRAWTPNFGTQRGTRPSQWHTVPTSPTVAQSALFLSFAKHVTHSHPAPYSSI